MWFLTQVAVGVDPNYSTKDLGTINKATKYHTIKMVFVKSTLQVRRAYRTR